MKMMIRWLAGLMAAILLTLSAAMGLFCLVTTDWWAERALASRHLQEKQQTRIDEAAEELAKRWQVSPEVIAPYTEGAASAYTLYIVSWWASLWQSDAPDTVLPVYLTGQQERSLIAEVMADPQFAAAHDAAMLRAIARDEVAYGLDEIVCGTVLPLRRSVVELAAEFLQEQFGLMDMRRTAAMGAGILAGAALLLTAMNRKAAGTMLITSGGLMALASVPVWLMDVHRMLRELNSIAPLQGDCMLLWMAIPWYGAALLLFVLGTVIIRIRDGRI